jgi:GntR family transcriptional regulator
MNVDKGSVRPLYLQIEDSLRSQIDSGQLRPGDRVPSEKELAAIYDVSRMTARRATDALVTEGVLVRQPGKGTFVAQDKLPFAAATLSSFSNTMRVLGLSVTSRVIDLQLVDPPLKVVKDLQLIPGQQVVYLRRLRLIDGEPMALMSTFMAESFYPALAAADLSAQPITQIMEAASGLKLVASRDHIEASLARPDEAELLGIRTGAPVLLARGIVYESGGMPMRSSKVVYRGDRFRLSLSAEDRTGTQVRLPDHALAMGDQWLTLSFNLAE